MSRGLIVAMLLLVGCRPPVPEAGQPDDSAGSSATQTGDGSTGGEDSTDTGGGFEPVNDIAPEATPCDTLMPDCEPGYKCTLRVSSPGSCCVDEEVCLPIFGDDAPGEPCMALGDDPGLDGLDTCGAGSWCTEIEPNTTVGTCRLLCTGKASDLQCPQGQTCEIYGSKVPAICRDLCDPLDLQACPAGEACMGPTGAFFCRPTLPTDPADYGEDCFTGYDCGPGLTCVHAAEVPACAETCCTQYCALDQPNTCPDAGQGQTCEPLPGGPVEGYENVGRCGLP